MKILIRDNGANRNRFEDFEIKGDRSANIEEELIAWWLESSCFDNTLKMVEESMDVTITVIDDSEVEL